MKASLFAAAVSAATDWAEVATVVIAGVGIVLAVLIVLIAVFYIFGMLVSKSENLAKARKDGKTHKTAAANEAEKPRAAVQIPAGPAQAESGANNGELIAVISAAVAAREQSGNFVIKSIKKKNVSGRNNAWARAAVIENTKSF